MSSDRAVRSCVNNLKTYLEAIPGLTVLAEWPNANQQLKYPSVTLTSGNPKIMNRTPEVVALSPIDSKKQITATEIVAEIDFQLQLDLWCADKAMRSKYMDLILDAINSGVTFPDIQGKNIGMGLSLQLADYYNDWVRFDIDNHQYKDDEQAAERRERRAMIILLVNCREIRQRKYYAMKYIQTNTEVATEITETIDLNGTDPSIVEN